MTTRYRQLVLVVAALAVAPVPLASAQPAPDRERPAPNEPTMADRLRQGLAEFVALDYEKAIRTLGPLHRDPTATRSERLSALEIIAISALILGDRARAKEAFEDLLAIDPGYQLRHDDGSPKIRDFFATVKGKYVPGFDPNARVQLELGVPTGATAGRRLEVEARVLGGSTQVIEMVVRWRRRGVLGYVEVQMLRRTGDLWRASFRLPASRAAFVIDYYIEARGAAGASLGRVGGPETPLGLSVAAGSASASRSWYARWYVIAGGAALLGIGTTALVLSGRDTAGSGSLEPGRVTLTP